MSDMRCYPGASLEAMQEKRARDEHNAKVAKYRREENERIDKANKKRREYEIMVAECKIKESRDHLNKLYNRMDELSGGVLYAIENIDKGNAPKNWECNCETEVRKLYKTSEGDRFDESDYPQSKCGRWCPQFRIGCEHAYNGLIEEFYNKSYEDKKEWDNPNVDNKEKAMVDKIKQDIMNGIF